MKGNQPSLPTKIKEQMASMHKRLDVFIQSSLDKFNFVEPWKDLYDVTGQFAYYIISNQSTIPDLVIFNKGFDKNECFVESKSKEYNKFPRKHFILHLKTQKGKEKEKVASVIQIESIFEEQAKDVEEKKVNALPLPKPQVLPQLQPMPQSQFKQKQKAIDSEDEEDPEWGDDDVSEFKRTKVDFKEIPIELQKELEEIIGSDHGLEDKVEATKEPQVITGDELFQVDPETLFNPIPANVIPPNTKASQKEVKTDTQAKESQFKKEVDFFKDLGSNQKQNDSLPSFNNNQPVNSNIWLNQKNAFFNQQPNNNSQSNNNMFMLNSQMKDMMMKSNSNTPYKPMQPMPYAQFMQNRMPNPNLFPNVPMQPMNMWPQYQNPSQSQMNMIRQQQMANQSKANPFNYFNQFISQEEEEGQHPNIPTSTANEDDDDLMSDFNTKFNLYNPSVFLENPGLIVKKNLFEANWFLMKDNKIIGNYNSEELFFFLSEKINDKEKLDDVSISDYHTDVFFKPTNLLEILKEFVPKLKKKLEMKQMSSNQFMPPLNQFNQYQLEQNYIQMNMQRFPEGHPMNSMMMNINNSSNNQHNNY